MAKRFKDKSLDSIVIDPVLEEKVRKGKLFRLKSFAHYSQKKIDES